MWICMNLFWIRFRADLKKNFLREFLSLRRSCICRRRSHNIEIEDVLTISMLYWMLCISWKSGRFDKNCSLSKIKYLSPDNLVIDFERTVFAVKSGGTAELYLRPFLYRIRYEIGTKIFYLSQRGAWFRFIKTIVFITLICIDSTKIKINLF